MPDALPAVTVPFFSKAGRSLVKFSIQYYKDFVEPNKKYKKPTEDEKKVLEELIKVLKTFKSEFFLSLFKISYVSFSAFRE